MKCCVDGAVEVSVHAVGDGGVGGRRAFHAPMLARTFAASEPGIVPKVEKLVGPKLRGGAAGVGRGCITRRFGGCDAVGEAVRLFGAKLARNAATLSRTAIASLVRLSSVLKRNVCLEKLLTL